MRIKEWLKSSVSFTFFYVIVYVIIKLSSKITQAEEDWLEMQHLRREASIPNNPYFISPVARTNTSIGVTITIAITRGTNLEEFATALNRLVHSIVQCYTALHGYNLIIENDDKFKECAVHKDKFFRRHCHVHMLMKAEIPEDDYVLFIDGDVGVVNPNRLVEEFIEDGYEIYLMDRFYNWEFAAQYMVKNNERGRNWVDEFAKYEFKLPNSFTGTDNGALHPFMMQYLEPDTRDPKTRGRVADLCLSIWDRSKNWTDVFSAQACTRMVIGEHSHFPVQKVKIFQKGDAWQHDSWIFHSHWSTDDFMIHSFKKKYLTPYPTTQRWKQRCGVELFEYNFVYGACAVVFPVLNNLNIDKCKNGTERWLMEGRLQIDNETRKKVFDETAYWILKKQMEAIGKTAGKFL